MTDRTRGNELRPTDDTGKAREERDAIRQQLDEKQKRYTRYLRELDQLRHLLAYATPEDDPLEIAKASAMIPVYEQTLARLRPEIRDAEQELLIAERELRRLEDERR